MVFLLLLLLLPINFGNLAVWNVDYTFTIHMSFLFYRIGIANMIPFIILFIEWTKNKTCTHIHIYSVDVFNNSQFTRYTFIALQYLLTISGSQVIISKCCGWTNDGSEQKKKNSHTDTHAQRIKTYMKNARKYSHSLE